MSDLERRVNINRGEDFWPQLFDPFRHLGQAVSNFFAPSVDASTSTESYEINLELPGVAEDDVEVTVHDDTLTIKGEKKSEREEKKKDYYFSERRYGAFQRSFRLPPDVNAEGIAASFDKGVLTVTLPKVESKAPEKRKISISSK